MLKRRDAADYNPACRRGDSPSVCPSFLLLFSSLHSGSTLSSSSAPVRCAALRCGSPAATEWRGCPVPGGEDALAPLALCQVMEGNEEGGLLRDCSGSEQSAPPPLTAVLKTLRVPAGGPRTGLTGSVWLTAAPRLTLNRAV